MFQADMAFGKQKMAGKHGKKLVLKRVVMCLEFEYIQRIIIRYMQLYWEISTNPQMKGGFTKVPMAVKTGNRFYLSITKLVRLI